MDKQDLEGQAAVLLDAWNSQDVERVAACYAEDVRYRDPNTRGHVEGRDALQRYLRKLFATWQMTWARRFMQDWEWFPNADAALSATTP